MGLASEVPSFSPHTPSDVMPHYPPTGLVLCPDYFLHAEGKNSLVNSLFNFCSMRHDRGAPIRLLHENDVMY